MKAVFALLALATSAIAQDLVPRWYPTTTLTVYTTTTYCPVTSTTVEQGTTKYVTTYTTSTITVTSCIGGCGTEVTVTAPSTTTSTETEVTTYYTTTCPVTETTTISGKEVTIVYTTTSIVQVVVPTTVEAYTTLAPETTTIETWVYETSTSLCPVTEVQTVSGAEVTVVYTSTSLIVKQVPTTIIAYVFHFLRIHHVQCCSCESQLQAPHLCGFVINIDLLVAPETSRLTACNRPLF
jgi:hypothetical protein